MSGLDSNPGTGELILASSDPNEAGGSAALGSGLQLARSHCLVHAPAAQGTPSHRFPWPPHQFLMRPLAQAALGEL